MFSLLTSPACSNKEAEAKRAVEAYLKSMGAYDVKDVKVDLFLTDPNLADKGYVAVTTTYNFATADGKLQAEYAGYILRKQGQEWKVEENTSYTKDEKKALDYLADKKRQ